MAQFTEEEKIIRRIEKRFSKGLVEYGLIEDGDKILIGLSGGKDSLALVELLAKRARVFKPRFSVVAVHVVMKNIPYQSDLAYLREYVESWNIPFVLYETEFDASTDTRKSPCFLCSWNRRKALFTVAKEQGCNKIALGHNEEDVLETFLLNLFYAGSIGTFSPKSYMNKSEITLIRPLIYAPEKYIQNFVKRNNIEVMPKACPMDGNSKREDMKKLIQSFYKDLPHIRSNLYGAIKRAGLDGWKNDK